MRCPTAARSIRKRLVLTSAPRVTMKAANSFMGPVGNASSRPGRLFLGKRFVTRGRCCLRIGTRASIPGSTRQSSQVLRRSDAHRARQQGENNQSSTIIAVSSGRQVLRICHMLSSQSRFAPISTAYCAIHRLYGKQSILILAELRRHACSSCSVASARCSY